MDNNIVNIDYQGYEYNIPCDPYLLEIEKYEIVCDFIENYVVSHNYELCLRNAYQRHNIHKNCEYI
jgi:hypothetical protein